MKLFICGQARHGKDAVAEILARDFGFRYESSSRMAMRMFLRKELHLRGLVYGTYEECYADRVNHRKLWFDLICDYNKEDLARLCRNVFKDNDIYVGVRNREELYAAKVEGLADLSIWVDAMDRVGRTESKESNTVVPEDCDMIITNNGTLIDLEIKLERIFCLFDLVT